MQDIGRTGDAAIYCEIKEKMGASGGFPNSNTSRHISIILNQKNGFVGRDKLIKGLKAYIGENGSPRCSGVSLCHLTIPFTEVYLSVTPV